MTYFKRCVVPAPVCTNSTINSPEKIFLYVPKDPQRRNNWFAAIVNSTNIDLQWHMLTNYYICEDHFDVSIDIKTLFT